MNPTLKVTDIKRISKISHQHDCLFNADNTLMSPFSQLPVLLGAEIALYSVNKYINGHTDVIMEVLCLNEKELFE